MPVALTSWKPFYTPQVLTRACGAVLLRFFEHASNELAAGRKPTGDHANVLGPKKQRTTAPDGLRRSATICRTRRTLTLTLRSLNLATFGLAPNGDYWLIEDVGYKKASLPVMTAHLVLESFCWFRFENCGRKAKTRGDRPRWSLPPSSQVHHQNQSGRIPV